MEISDGTDSHRRESAVWFCDPWPPALGLLGLTGYFHHFEVQLASSGQRRSSAW